MRSQEPEHLHWFTHRQQGRDNRATVPRKYPTLAELEKSAIVNKAWRVEHPDPNRCNTCHETDHRMVNVRYKITDNGKDNGVTIGHVEREHRVCNRCHPDPNQLTLHD